jgi:hypothetical protein
MWRLVSLPTTRQQEQRRHVLEAVGLLGAAQMSMVARAPASYRIGARASATAARRLNATTIR